MLNPATSPESLDALPEDGVIGQVGMLDLRAVSADELSRVKALKQVGCLVVSESVRGSLLGIAQTQIGTTIVFPDDSDIELVTRTGDIEMTGESFAPEDGAKKCLVVTGQLRITTPIQACTYARVIVTGVVFAPQGSEQMLEQALTEQQGQIVYYAPGSRFFVGQEHFDAAFLELLGDRTPLVIIGKAEFGDDVTPELVKAKLGPITVTGELMAPPAVVPVLKFLATKKQGAIKARGGSE